MRKINRRILLEKHGIDLPDGKFRITVEDGQYRINSVKDDTEGCLLPGTSFATNEITGEHMVMHSRNAFHLLMQKIEASIDADEQVWLEVT